MAIEADGTARIARPREVVFDYVADPRNEPDWLPGARAVEMVGDGPVALGSRFVGEYARAGRVELELVEFERPSRVTFRAGSRIVLVARMTAEPRGVMRLFAPLMARTMRSQFAGNWEHLRAALERR